MYKILQKIGYLTIAGVALAPLLFPEEATAASTIPTISIVGVLRIFGANMGLPDTDPRVIAARLIRAGMGFIGIVVLLMIMSSGAQLMVSGGEKEKVASAKKTFFNAIMGLFIMLSAYSIVAFVFRALSVADA